MLWCEGYVGCRGERLTTGTDQDMAVKMTEATSITTKTTLLAERRIEVSSRKTNTILPGTFSELSSPESPGSGITGILVLRKRRYDSGHRSHRIGRGEHLDLVYDHGCSLELRR